MHFIEVGTSLRPYSTPEEYEKLTEESQEEVKVSCAIELFRKTQLFRWIWH